MNGAFNAVTIESPAITEITLSGPGAGGIQTASAVLGDVISAMIPPPSLPPPAVELPIVTDVEFAFYLHLEVADRPGVLAQVAEILGLQGVSIRSVVQKGLGEDARLVMVMHPVLESKFRAAVELLVAARLRARAAARDPGDRGDRSEPLALPRPAARRAARDDGRGRHAAGPRAAAVGADRRGRVAQARGREPDRLVQGPRDDGGGVSAAVAEGAEAVICASTGNTAASAAAYAARAGLRGAVIVPEGKIATGKLAQALMHGARVIALRGNFDEALALVRELAKRHPIALVNSVNDFRIEGQKTGAFEVCDELGEAPDVLCIPVGQRRQRDLVVEGLPGVRGGAAACTATRPRAPRRWCTARRWRRPETVASAIRIGNPARWEDAMNAFTASRGEVRAVSDDEILDAYSLLGAREGVFCEPASAASVAGLLKYGAEGRVVACSPATG